MRMIAASILLVLTLAASVFMLRAPFHYEQQDRDNVNASATHQHLTGTDDLGRDRTVRLAGALLLGLIGAAVLPRPLPELLLSARAWALRLRLHG